MAKPTRSFVDGEYGQIHLRVSQPDKTPTRPPLYCLHMSPKSGRQFVGFMDAASTDRIVVAPDNPGHGESDPPPSTPHVNIMDYARNAWMVADALGHEEIDLFGHHTGSKVAVEMAHQQPHRVKSIVIVSAVVISDEERDRFMEFFSPIPLDEEGNRFRIMWERIREFRGPGMTLEMMAESMAENLRGGENYEWGHRAAFEYGDRFNEIVAALPHRITILNPRDELYESTKRAAALLNNGEIIDCPTWAHGFLDVFTEDVVDIVKKSLA